MEESTFLKRLQEFDAGPAHDSSHQLRSLETGEVALLARIALIRAAKKTIDIQTFIWANDECGRFVFFELLQAARRGVVIRLLIDGWVVTGDPAFLAWMCVAHENLQVRRYNPPSDRLEPNKLQLFLDVFEEPKEINQRCHNKLFLVDGYAAIVGGRNYQNRYYDRGSQLVFRDRDVLVLSAAAAATMQESFDEFWQHERAVPGEQLKDFSKVLPSSQVDGSKEFFNFDSIFNSIQAALESATTIDGQLAENWFTVEKIEYVSDPPESDPLAENRTVQYLAERFREIRHQLLLQTPYFVLDTCLYTALEEVRKHNPEVAIRLATNSMAASDTPIAYAHSYRERVRYLARLLLEIYELKPRPGAFQELLGWHGDRDLPQTQEESTSSTDSFRICCHAKTFVFDNQAVWIGSANLDPRSARVNTENGLYIQDTAFAEYIASFLERDMAPENSWTIGLSEDAPILARLRTMLDSWDSSGETFTEEMLRFPAAFDPVDPNRQVPHYHQDFYSCYREVGKFPEVEDSVREIQARITALLPPQTKRLV